MIPVTTLLLAVLAPLTPVRGLGVVPVADRTEVLIEVEGQVSVKHYLLRQPDRVVIDLAGARHALPQNRFTDINRGGVLALRVSQYQPDVVRVVVDLAQPVEYTVDREAGIVRVSFPNPGSAFEPWHAGTRTAPPAVAASPAPPPPAQAAVRAQAQAQTPRISVSFQQTPILDVLATFAEFSNRSIVAGADVTGTVTADIRDQPWDVALRAILDSHGLTAREEPSGIIRVENMKQLRDRETTEDLVTRQYRVKYASADSLVKAVEALLSQRGKVSVNRSANALVVTDSRSVLERIEPAIRQLDLRTPQVTIAAKIIFIDRTALEEMGFIYDLKDIGGGNQLNRIVSGFADLNGNGVYDPDESTDQDVIILGGNSIAALANASTRIASPQLQVAASLALSRHALVTFIDALQELRLSDVQAAPVITTLDNREASIHVGEETPIRVIDLGTATGGGSGVNLPRATVQIKPTGIILKVTPHVTGNQVLLDLHAERSSLALAPSDIGYTFQTQSSRTQVLLNDGETAVIGGLTVVEKAESRSGIPFLMNLPLVGRFFRTTSERESKKDLLIMVTPHIVRETEG